MKTNIKEYQSFIDAKLPTFNVIGLEPEDPNPKLYDFQKDIVKWALRRGRSSIFADCGMGKTPIQLEWAKQISSKVGQVLIVAPLAVSQQTIREGEKFGVQASYCRDQSEVSDLITVTNYEMLEAFDPAKFAGVVLDESSILKNFDGKTRNQIIESFSQTQYKLACTATPAPNDHMELGNHAEFVGAMSRTEMLSMFFVHDGGETQKWRLKRHAMKDFWAWVCSWAIMIRKPSDLGYEDRDFILPKLNLHERSVESNGTCGDFLFPMEARTLQERISARRSSIDERVAECAGMVNDSKEPWVIWCNLNSEADALEKAIPDAKQVRGSDSLKDKVAKLSDFAAQGFRVLVTKPSICGFGLNWQHCRNVAFVGLSDSWEQYYQAVRRCWRFGQKKEVHVHIVISEAEGAVLANIKRKEKDAENMAKEMVKNMSEINSADIHGTKAKRNDYSRAVIEKAKYKLYRDDCVVALGKQPDESIDFSVFSPPFASLYTYSASERDMGNCKDHDEFFKHFSFAVKELFRVLKSGRLVSFHCMNLPTSKTRDGVIGIRDFRGELIKLFESVGFIYHSEVCIWKDPVTAMQRTKALGLLWKQIKKDSCMSRQGIADYLVTMRKPGENKNPVSHTPEGFPVDQWQQWASPVWMDINPSDTLQYRSARTEEDERHICPLQLEVIKRALVLWSNPGDLVLSPFAGIGSEGVMSLKLGRRFMGMELKESYFEQMWINLQDCEKEMTESELFKEELQPA